MNQREYLLTKLMEECAEVQQRASKAQIFGDDETEPDDACSNMERLREEMSDLLTIWHMMGEDVPEPQREKMIKVVKYMEYSRELGILE